MKSKIFALLTAIIAILGWQACAQNSGQSLANAYRAAQKQRQIDQENYQYQQQQAAIAAQNAAKRKAEQAAAAKAEYNAALAKLTGEKDDAIAKLDTKYPIIVDLESQAKALEQKAAEIKAQMSEAGKAVPLFKEVNGKIYSVEDALWKDFQGDCLKVSSKEIIISTFTMEPVYQMGTTTRFVPGVPGAPGRHEVDSKKFIVGENKVPGRKIILRNYPAELFPAVGQTITFRAMLVGTFDYSGDTLELWDYGKKSNFGDDQMKQQAAKLLEAKQLFQDNQNQLSAVKLKLSQTRSDFDKERDPITDQFEAKVKDLPNVLAKQAKEKADAKKQAVVDKVLKSNLDAADKGDAYGLLRMGERYRDGDGVPKDLTKARDYLSKAAAAGSPTAEADLKNLPAN
jgi:hypothetical protein